MNNKEVMSLSEQSNLKLFNQLWVCSESYKKILASMLNGAVIPIGDYLAEVLMLEEMMFPYVESKKKESKYAYLKDVEGIRKYRANPAQLRENLEKHEGRWLVKGYREDELKRGLNRQRLVSEFEVAREALNRLAFDIGFTDLRSHYAGVGLQ